jgi:hypothetical protein
MTSSRGRESELLGKLRQVYPDVEGGDLCGSYLDYADAVIAAAAASEGKIRTEIEAFFDNQLARNPTLSVMIKANWTAVIALCSDDHLRQELRDFIYKKPTNWALSTVASSNDTISQTTVPYYALLGDIRDKRETHRLAISRSQYLKRTRTWTEMLHSLPDIIKADPLVFMGTDNIVERVCDLMNELFKLAPRIPKRLIFLADDHTPSNPVFKNLVTENCQLQIVEATLREIGDVLSKESLSISKLPLFADTSQRTIEFKALADIEDQVAYVPRKEEVDANPEERNRLVDSLFRPTHLDWAPYNLEMQFRRDICEEVQIAIRNAFLGNPEHSARIIRLSGETGIGKTVALRTIAFDLAQDEYLCLWIKKSYGEVSGGRFETVITSIAKGLKRKKTKVVFFLDDPWGSRVRPREVIASLEDAPFEWVLVICDRKSDVLLSSPDRDSQVVSNSVPTEIPADFSEAEIQRLPEYLLSLNVAEDLENARRMMLAPGMKHSRDILCSLWYMLPQTQGAIEESLITEYQRLGEVEKAITALASAAGASKSIARRAYELVTTTSGFGNTPLPVEVLVSALGVSYQEWGESSGAGKPLWGLLYDEDYPSAESYAYRTRNTVVTEVLLRMLNKGTSGHTGEFRCLKELIRACKSASAPYRTFLKDILVERRKLIESRFNFEQAMELYELAQWAYPRPFALLDHHKCIVKRHLGGNLQKIYDEIKMLIRKSYDRTILDQDSPANLNTSAAATLNRLVKTGEINPVDGANLAFDHISHALADDQYSLHTHHVHADMLVGIGESLRDEDEAACMLNLSRAAAIIDRALLLVPPQGPKSAEQHQSVGMLKRIRERILMGVTDLDSARALALQHFDETGDQVELAFVARIMLGKAIETSKGGNFKKVAEFLREAFKRVTNRSGEPSSELSLCRVELIINWHILPNHGPVYWEQFVADINRLQESPRFLNDSLLSFFGAVGKFHLRQYPDAEVLFQRLRMDRQRNETRGELRCYYIGDKTEPQVLEGRIRDAFGEKRFIYCPELGTDVLVKHRHLTLRPDEPQHCKIGFSMLGPIAVER